MRQARGELHEAEARTSASLYSRRRPVATATKQSSRSFVDRTMYDTKTFSRRDALVALSALTASTCLPLKARANTGTYPLWEIRNGNGTVYLLGHTPPRIKTWTDSRIEGLLRSCGVLWTETEHKRDALSQDVTKKYIVYPAGSLPSHLSAADRERLSIAAKAAGVPIDSLDPLRPWAAGATMEESFYGRIGQTQNASQVLYTKAMAMGIATASEFPTTADAVRWFATFTVEQQVEFLRYTMDEVLQGTTAAQQTYEAWAHGDARPADAWVERLKTRYPEVYSPLVLERNRAWVTRIASMLESRKPSMVVVGFYHLSGPDRLQDMLRSSGFSVKST